MSYQVLPGPLSPMPVKRDTDQHTQVFATLCRLLTIWRDDPERLATACAAWTLFGFPSCNIFLEVASSYPYYVGENASITDDEARELVDKALFRKNAKILRAKGYGLLMGLIEFAPAVDRDRLHAIRLDAHVIECRELPVEERFERLRQEEIHPMAVERDNDMKINGV